MFKNTILSLVVLLLTQNSFGVETAMSSDPQQIKLDATVEEVLAISVGQSSEDADAAQVTLSKVHAAGSEASAVTFDPQIFVKMYSNKPGWTVTVESLTGFYLANIPEIEALYDDHFGVEGNKVCSAYNVPYQLTFTSVSGINADSALSGGKNVGFDPADNSICEVDGEEMDNITGWDEGAQYLVIGGEDNPTAEPSGSAGEVGDELMVASVTPHSSIKIGDLAVGNYTDTLTFTIIGQE